MLDLAEPKVDVDHPCLASACACLRDHLRSHVDADHATRRTDLPSGKETVESATATQVEHGLAHPEAGDGLRVTATETEIGPVWDGRQLV